MYNNNVDNNNDNDKNDNNSDKKRKEKYGKINENMLIDVGLQQKANPLYNNLYISRKIVQNR